MKIKRTALFIAVFGFRIALSQTYTALVDSASNALDRKEYASSVALYEKAFKMAPPGADDLYNQACAYALQGEARSAVTALEKAFSKGFNFAWMYHDTDLDGIRKDAAYQQFEKKYKPDSTLFYFDIIRALTEHEHVTFTGMKVDIPENIFTQVSRSQLAARLNINLAPSDSLFDFSDKALEFQFCKFSTRNSYNTIFDLALKSLTFIRCQGNLALLNIRTGDLNFLGTRNGNNELSNFKLKKVRQEGRCLMVSRGFIFGVEECYFNLSIPKETKTTTAMEWTLRYERSEIFNSSFNGPKENDIDPLDLRLNGESVKIVNVKFNYDTKLTGFVSDVVNIKRSVFPAHLDPFNFVFPERNIYMPFSQFKETKFVNFQHAAGQPTKPLGASIEDYADDEMFDMLSNFYKQLYDNYRSRADLESSNATYVRLKELEIAHLKQKPNKSSEQIIRLNINRIMGFYTDHATSPGKALVISFYLVVAFAAFYFLFPSEWDRSSKGALVEDFRRFIQKNEHGYVKPFLKLSKGFFLSFMNALTLSMNAFVTLGFGNIPTTGFARYACVAQGVLGWFLLSLFTVALLNQVLL